MTAPARTGRMWRGTLALGIAVLDIIGCVIVTVVLLSTGSEYLDTVAALTFAGAVLVFSGMGALLIRRVPTNPIGALLLTVGTIQVVGPGLAAYAVVGAAATPPWPAADLVPALGDVMYLSPYVIALVLVPLVFPSGRLPSRRFRWVVWATIAGLVAMLIPGIVSVVPSLTGLDDVLGALSVFSLVVAVFGFGGAAAAVWVNYRRGDATQRQQLKWLLADAGVATVFFPLALMFNWTNEWWDIAFWLVGFLSYLAIPVAIGVAILRYRLYDIDVIINRALVYGPLTAMIAGFYAASVALSGRLLANAGISSDAGVVLTTLVVVALFSPVKSAVQAAVDRRFKVTPHVVQTRPAPVPAPVEPPRAVGTSPVELVRDLGKLRDEGLLTAEEFEMKKHEILSQAWVG